MTIRHVALNLAVAAIVTSVIAVLVGPQGPGWVAGAVSALSLAVGVWIGSGPVFASWTLHPVAYARVAAMALAVGGLAWALTGADNGAWWSVGIVAAIALSAAPRRERERLSAERASLPEVEAR